jgi:ubiquinone/menaquinone biosynthesis C-methylase UbiE
MESGQLLEVLSSLEARPLGPLEARKREELEFHNEHHAQAHDSNEKFYVVANAKGGAIYHMHRWIESASKGKVFLDYACGTGFKTVLAAKSGAELAVGIDISDESLRLARLRALEAGVTNIRFLQADCEDTRLPDNAFDTILCSGMLHHLDLERAIPEMRRILKPGGRVLAVEALNYNPVFKWYRQRTPHLRTEWEAQHIIDHSKMHFISRFLPITNVRYFHLLDLAAVFLRNTPVYAGVRQVVNIIDQAILRIPGIRLLAWQIAFEMRKD